MIRRLPLALALALTALPAAAADIDGDGRDDLICGVPGEDLYTGDDVIFSFQIFGYEVGTIGDDTTAGGAGLMNILYGSSSGVSTSGDDDIDQDDANVSGTPEGGDGFGWTLASGDFDNDGYDDVAVGVPGESIGSVAGAGMVQIFYGDSTGILTSGSQTFYQGKITGAAETRDGFGYAVGDFDGDGYDDLAMGAPGEDIGYVFEASAVNVVYGSSSGLGTTRNQIFYQGSGGMPGVSELLDAFGQTLAAGDFNGDGRDDLAIGAPSESAGSLEEGAVFVINGSSSGPTTTSAKTFYQGYNGTPGAAEAGDQFGDALAAGDFNGDGKDELAIGAWAEDVGSTSDAGAVTVLIGASTGLSTTGSRMWYQGSGGLGGTATVDDWVGAALTCGDFDDDGFDDLVVGVPGEAVISTAGMSTSDAELMMAGAVQVVYGTSAGLASSTVETWSQDTGLSGEAEGFEGFGFSLATADYDGNGYADLAVGVPFEDVDYYLAEGAVNVIYGASSGLTSANDDVFSQSGDAVNGTPESWDTFGWSVL